MKKIFRLSEQWNWIIGLSSLAILSVTQMSASLYASDDDQVAGQFPVEYYTAPEDMPDAVSDAAEVPNAGDFSSHAGILPFRRLRGIEPTMRSIDRILGATGNALDHAKDIVGENKTFADHQKPANWVPWHLRQMILNLGITIQGTAGIITAIGNPAVEIYWNRRPPSRNALGLVSDEEKRKETRHSEVVTEGGGDPKVDLRFDDSTSPEEIETLIDPIAKTVMATKRVDDETEMRKGLKEVALNMQTLMSESAYVYNTPWLVQQYRVDVMVQITGKVSPGVDAGGAVRLRFEWNRRANRPFDAAPPPDDGARNLAKLFQSLGNDFEATRSQSGHNKFDLYAIQVAIGMYLNAKFAVVKGNFGVTGLVLFRRQQNVPVAAFDLNSGLDHIPMMESRPSSRHLSYADSHGVQYEKVSGLTGVIDRALYHVSRNAFRRGLERSARWGDKIAERSDSNAARKWFVSEIRPEFTLSIQGATPLITVGGLAMIEFRLNRPAPNLM